MTSIQDLLEKYQIKNGIENDQARIDEFVKELKACQQKHTYYSQTAGTRARKRRNKAAGIDYLRSYKCNVCGFWHVTSQKKDKEGGSE